MTTLELNQLEDFNDLELDFNDLFKELKIRKKSTNSKTLKENSIATFRKRISLLKSKNHATKLYRKLVEINKFVNAKYAQKFLDGFLEYRGLTFTEYLNLQN